MIQTSFKTITYTLFSLFLAISFAKAQAPRSYTSSEILLQVKKLNTVGAVLYIAAHPDDENTRLISYLASEKCLRTGYLSLTRGDGGQNLIGPEQGIELGVIRTQELLAARRVDGGEQFFTRAYDFGFSKSPDETFRKWNRDSVLGDMVWVIRNFKPDVIITRFATDGSGGHGHHTASAILAEEAFDAAADPNRFPEQLKYVSVWKTRRMFHNSTARFFNPNADLSHLIRLDVGGYNPLLGKNYGEIAAESRSMHKSQGFGSAKQRGEAFEYFKPIKGDTTGLKDIFDGMDFTWKRSKNSEPAWAQIEAKVNDIIRNFRVDKPEESLKELLPLRDLMKQSDSYKRNQLDQIIYNCSGLFIEAAAAQPVYAEKDTIRFTVTAINRSGSEVKNTGMLQNGGPLFDLQLKENSTPDTTEQKTMGKPLPFNNALSLKRAGIPLTFEQKSWLENGIQQNMFSPGDYMNRQLPQKSSFVAVNIPFDITTQSFTDRKEIVYKSVDPEKGELYRPLAITPPVMINMLEDVIAFADNKPKEVKILLKAGRDHITYDLKISTPDHWTIQEKPTDKEAQGSLVISGNKLVKKGEEKIVSFWITPKPGGANGKLTVTTTVDGIEYNKGYKEIRYDHIPVQTLFPKAEARLVKLDVIKKSKRIGYIPGAGDEVQRCLTQLGYEVITLTDEMLGKENLSQFDAIITGVRAYNTNERLASFKPRLMDYVSKGGNLIVQYNTNSFAGPFKADIGPYPFKITRDRITDEEAKVVMELSAHPVFNTPNKITNADFDGWIQERSIYNAGDWDSNYVAPISMADPNEKDNKGALLIAKHGKGNFVYTGLVFFRELPAGVPGAYRLMVNLIELGK